MRLPQGMWRLYLPCSLLYNLRKIRYNMKIPLGCRVSFANPSDTVFPILSDDGYPLRIRTEVIT